MSTAKTLKGKLPVYDELRQLYRQFALSTKKAPINIKRGAIAEVEHAIIQMLDSVAFAQENANKDQKLLFIRDAIRTMRFVEVRVRTLKDLGLIRDSGYSAITLHEESAIRQLSGWRNKTQSENE